MRLRYRGLLHRCPGNVQVIDADDHEHLADPIDEASRTEESIKQFAIDKRRHAARPRQVKLASGQWPITECVQCDTEIGIERIEATGTDICIDCARSNERRAARGY